MNYPTIETVREILQAAFAGAAEPVTVNVVESSHGIHGPTYAVSFSAIVAESTT